MCSSGGAKAALFVAGSKPVARFALEGRRPCPQGFGHQTGHGGVQLLVIGGAGGRHGGEDASRLIGAARQTGGELCAAVAGKNEVGMAVHEPGHKRPAGEVEIGVATAARYLARLPHPCDATVDGYKRAVGPAPERAVANGRVVGDEHPDVVENNRVSLRRRAHREVTESSRPRERFDGRAQRASHVADQEMLPALDHRPAGHDDIGDIVRAGGKYGRFQK